MSTPAKAESIAHTWPAPLNQRDAAGASQADESNLTKRCGPIAVIVACQFPANHGSPGSIREVVQAQVKAGYDVHIFTYPYGDDDEALADLGARVHRVRMIGRSRAIKVGPTWRRPLWDLLIPFKIAALSSQYKFSVIHAYNYEGVLAGWLASLLLRRPLLFHDTNNMSDELPSYNFIRPRWLAVLLARTLDYIVPRLADHVIAISDPLEKLLINQGIKTGRISKIPMGIDSSIFKKRDGRRLRQQYGLGERPVVVYAGLLNQFQRLDYLLEGMAIVHEARPEVRLVLVNNYCQPEERERLDSLIAQLGLQEVVIITQPLPFEAVPDHLAMADVCVISRPDCPGMAFKMLNYMAANKAIVLPKGSSMGLIHGHDAYIVADHDGPAIGRGILDLLRDDALRHQLGCNAAETLEKYYSLPSICQRIGQLYAGLAARGAAQRM